MKHRDTDPEPTPKPSGGSYPPDIARQRRKYRLPVTPAEHAAYDRGESPEPPATKAQMQATYERVAPRCSPAFRRVLLELIGRQREPGEEG